MRRYPRGSIQWKSFFSANDPDFRSDMLTHEEAGDWIATRRGIRDARGNAELVGTLSAVGLGLQAVPLVGTVLGGAALGAGAIISAGLNTSVTFGGVSTSVAQVGMNIGQQGAQGILLGAKASVPGQTAAAQKGYAIQGAGLAAQVAVPIAGAAIAPVGTAANVAANTVGNVAVQSGQFAARGDYSDQAWLEYGLGVAQKLASAGGKLGGSLVGQGAGVAVGGARTGVAVAKPLAPERR